MLTPAICHVPRCPHPQPCPDHAPPRTGSTRAWRRLRAQALRRDHGRCWCGAIADRVHHVIPRWRGGPDDLTNLRSLCAEHHRAIHHN